MHTQYERLERTAPPGAGLLRSPWTRLSGREVHRLETLEDRERIARELHDGTIQSLFTVGLGLQGTASLVGEPEAVR